MSASPRVAMTMTVSPRSHAFSPHAVETDGGPGIGGDLVANEADRRRRRGPGNAAASHRLIAEPGGGLHDALARFGGKARAVGVVEDAARRWFARPALRWRRRPSSAGARAPTAGMPRAFSRRPRRGPAPLCAPSSSRIPPSVLSCKYYYLSKCLTCNNYSLEPSRQLRPIDILQRVIIMGSGLGSSL